MSTDFIPAVRVVAKGARVVVFRVADMKPLIELARSDRKQLEATAAMFERCGLRKESSIVSRSIRY